jgi:hypothetical protein
MKLPFLKAKNKLTGNEYVLSPDSTNRKKPKYTEFAIDEFEFTSIDDIDFVDREGKKRNFEFSKSDIIEFCKGIIGLHRGESEEIINFTHDIQYLVGSLVHNSIVRRGQENNLELLKSKLDKINIISIIISAKNTYFRYLTEDIDFLKPQDVDISGKTFKVSKSIPFLAESQGKAIKYNFETSGNSHYKKCMVNVFDFIPFQIIENAIKYSPREAEIDIGIFSDSSEIILEIESMGPLLEDGETELIFEKGYRGVNARKLEVSGHGLGLAQTRKALYELTQGIIFAHQGGYSVDINGIPYTSTKFVLKIPK